ncbi:hypothetical protein EVAR_55756_1 [Eumeta japonica]|uniref:Uncharacterized protein n=1 Tax=Eumeta variegata TaxID=151549 RepID=A0A4C1XA81_EUMVA|nr:hypothetical protein EVAR_55756_1 [Eumeta japonica]
MSTRPGLSGEQVVGALGDAWAHRCNKRILLSRPEGALITGERIAAVLKSCDSPQNVAQFQITKEGIRDIQ